MLNEAEIVQIQIERQIKNLGKLCLEISEENQKYIKILETLLISMGIEKYNESNFDYNKDRKKILDRTMDTVRGLQSLISSFDVKLKRE